MEKNIFNIIIFIGVILGIFFNFYTLSSKKGKHKTIIYLNLLVLFLTLNNFQTFLIDCVFMQPNFFIGNILFPFYFLILPSFYQFLIYYLNVEKNKFSFFKICILIFLVEFFIRVVLHVYHFDKTDNYIVAKYAQVEEILNALFSLFLFYRCYFLIFKEQHLYQNILSFESIKWLKTFIYLGSFVFLLWICAIVINLDKVINPRIFIYYPMRLGITFLMFWISYHGFFNHKIIVERVSIRSKILLEKLKPEISKKFINLNSEKNTDHFLKLAIYLENNQSYLNPDLSLQIIAKQLNLSPSKLSEIIKINTNQNFSDFINEIRIGEAKKFLKNKDFKNYTIASIGLECGFNSKSTFYTAFKKFNGN